MMGTRQPDRTGGQTRGGEMIQHLIDKLEKVASDTNQPEAIRSAAREQAEGYKAAWASKQATTKAAR